MDIRRLQIGELTGRSGPSLIGCADTQPGIFARASQQHRPVGHLGKADIKFGFVVSGGEVAFAGDVWRGQTYLVATILATVAKIEGQPFELTLV